MTSSPRPDRGQAETPTRCPFCGGPAREPIWYNGAWETGCAGPHECAGTDVLAPVSAWNRRSTASPPHPAQPVFEALDGSHWRWNHLRGMMQGAPQQPHPEGGGEETLTPENRALVDYYTHEGFDPDCAFSTAELNHLLNAARQEGRAQPHSVADRETVAKFVREAVSRARNLRLYHIDERQTQVARIVTDTTDAILSALSVQPGRETWTPTHRHVKRGGLYRLTGHAKLQTEGPIGDDTYLYIYQDERGLLWARPADEFNDGRFESLSVPAGGGGGGSVALSPEGCAASGAGEQPSQNTAEGGE